MEESLSFVVTLEGGQPLVSLVVLEGYRHPSRILEAPFNLVDFKALVRSAQATGDYWIINATPDLPQFQVESAIFVRHREGKILWDIVFEHYEPFLDVELDMDEEDGDFDEEFSENVITLTFDPFQYVSAMYQLCQLYPQLQPTMFKAESRDESLRLEHFMPQLHILWRRYGAVSGAVDEEGVLVREEDDFAKRAEEQWTDEVLQALVEMQSRRIMDNIDAYLSSLPEEIQAKLEANSKNIGDALNARWEKLVSSLTDEEAEALETNQAASKFPNSLKLRLIREFLEGNPSVLLGNSLSADSNMDASKIVNLEHWRSEKR